MTWGKRQLVFRHNQSIFVRGPYMPRQAELRQHKGQWCTNTGNRQGVYFGRVADIPYSEAKRLFRDYLSSLGQTTRQHQLPASSVAEVCDDHLSWIKRNRSDALYSQRKCLLVKPT